MNELDYIARVFRLDPFERHCVGAVLERELSEEPDAWTVGELAGAYGQALAAEEVCGAFRWDGLLLRFFFLCEDAPVFLRRRVRLRRRMLEYLTGNAVEVHPAYRRYLELYWEKEEPRAEEAAGPDLTGQLAELAARQQNSGVPCLIGLFGPEGAGRRYQVKRFYRQMGRPLLLAAASVFGSGEDADAAADAILSECLFFQSGLMLCGLERDAVPIAVLKKLFSVLPVIFASAASKQYYFREEDGFSSCWIETGKLTYEEALSLWRQAVSGYACAPDVALEEMPNKYTMTPGMIRRVAELAGELSAARSAGEHAGGPGLLTAPDLREACHEMLARDVGGKIQRIVPVCRWDDLVLPERQKRMLMTGCDQVRYKNRVYAQWGFDQKVAYGRGVSMVFSGLPGTGKTMAAQVIASELGMDLYRVELPTVVSKYIGETEKNLEEIFAQAEKSQVILFFDEADVLFAKRTEVKSSNDKYSNMEAAYMLQKMESYDGITILSTNYLQNFDEAFRRRIRMIIDFPFPDAENRGKIWRQVFPEKAPVADDVDFDYLARQFEFSGSNIRNAALYATFQAAARGRAVSMQDLIAGVKNESAKVGKMLQSEDLGEYYMFF